MIRVLHVIDTTGSGGAETVFVNLVKGLNPSQFESFAVIHGPGWVCDSLRKHGIEPIFVKCQRGFNVRYLLKLIGIANKYHIDVIQAHLLGASMYCCLAGLISRIPVISTIHGFVDAGQKNWLMRVRVTIINRGSNKIVFVSDQLREQYVDKLKFSALKAVTVYNGVDTSLFYPKKDQNIRDLLSITSGQILVGAVGNIRPAKGYEILLQAARLVHDRYYNCRFVVAGEGSEQAYEKLLKLRSDLDLDEVFFFVGFQEDAARVYNNFDIYVLPSISEGFSISTIEAMACGLPVIVTKSGGPEEIVVDGENGILCLPNNPEDLAEKILFLLNQKRCNADLKKEGCRYVSERFSLKKLLKIYSDFYMQANE